MSYVMVLRNEMEQLHLGPVDNEDEIKEEMTPNSDLAGVEVFGFDLDSKAPCSKGFQPFDKLSYQQSSDSFNTSCHSNLPLVEVVNNLVPDNDTIESDISTTTEENLLDSQKLSPPSEPLAEKELDDAGIKLLDISSNQNVDLEKGGGQISECQAEHIEHQHLRDNDASDDDLLDELDKVVLMNGYSEESKNETVSAEDFGDVAHGSAGDKTALHVKKMEALQRRLNYIMQERNKLELDNINFERKIETLVKNHALESKEILDSMEVQKNKTEELKQKLLRQMDVSEREVQRVQGSHRLEVEGLNKKLEGCKRENDEMVVRFAMAEQKNIDLTDKMQKTENKLKDWSKERETALNRWKALKDENKRAFEICEAQKSEISQLKKDNERLKESESSNEMKIKWHQNKLKAEQDSHKETSTKLSEINRTTADLRTDATFVFKTVRSIYSMLQELYTCQSNQQTLPPLPALPPKLDEANLTQVFSIIRKDVQTLLWKQGEMVAEMRTYKDKIHCLELERLSQQDELSSFRNSLKTQQRGNEDLKEEVLRLQDIEEDYDRITTELRLLTEKLKEFEASNEDLASELLLCKSRETENLEFNSKLSQVNSELKTINDTLSQEFESKSVLCNTLQGELTSLQSQLLQMATEKDALSTETSNAICRLTERLGEASKKSDELTKKKHELEDEIKTTNRRHASIVKDLRRHITGGRRPLTSDDLKTHQDTGSLYSSHGGSCLSLDTGGGCSVAGQPSPPSQQAPQKSSPKPVNECPVVNSERGGDDDDDVSEEVAYLLKHLKRKTMKLTFLKEHVSHLTEELHRKSKIIREYALREESGSLVPEASDKNKALLSKKGGIMASLYGSNAQDSGMTMSLSLEINRKLQALVEDTLLKNIKYKESMDLLGREIEWLSNENKTLKAQLCDKDVTFNHVDDLRSPSATFDVESLPGTIRSDNS